jgi:hypothetical protein
MSNRYARDKESASLHGRQNEGESPRTEDDVSRTETVRIRQHGSIHSKSLRTGPNKLDTALKSCLDNVIIPALVREYLAEIEKQNRLAATRGSEVTSE